MRLKRGLSLLLVFVMSLPLAGCWDRRELEEIAFMLAMGVDKGEKSTYAVTFMIALPAKLAGGGGGEGGGGGGGGKDDRPYMITTVDAPTIASALAIINTSVDRRVSLIQNRALFMGEDLAKISGLRTMDEITRFRESRRANYFVVVKGRASEFLDKMKPEMEKSPSRYMEEMANTFRYTGMVPRTGQIHHFVTTVNSGYASPLTYYAALSPEADASRESGGNTTGRFKAGDIPKKGGPNVEWVGGAAFSKDKMVGVLTGEEMRTLSILRNDFRRGYWSVRDPQQGDRGLYVSVDIQRGRPVLYSVDVTGARPRIRIDVTLEAEIMAIQSDVDYTDPEKQGLLETALSTELLNDANALIAKTKAWEADVLGLGRQVVRQFPTVAAWEAYDWPPRYKTADVEVHVRITLRRFGLQMSPPTTGT